MGLNMTGYCRHCEQRTTFVEDDDQDLRCSVCDREYQGEPTNVPSGCLIVVSLLLAILLAWFIYGHERMFRYP